MQLSNSSNPFPLLTSLTQYRSLRQFCRSVASALALPFALVTCAAAQNSVTVAWNANTEPDIAGYVVYLGTTSSVYPTILDVGKVTSRILPGLSPGTVYFCAVQAYNSSGLVSALSNEISFTLLASTVAFNSWASAGGLAGGDAAPSATPFHDGVQNLLKFAFNMNPAGPDARTLVKGTGAAGLPAFTLDQSGPQPLFTVEFLRRIGSGLVYTPKNSTNFSTYETMSGTTNVTNINANWERVIVKKTVSTSTTPRLFGRVEVTMP
ncbi:MAG: fibronectin type III domain-containing protein [Luteolibacter sp.]|jgi:hypothetical protein|nr:fibronectin type III domain-containing protein [Luteolibacter sp.]